MSNDKFKKDRAKRLQKYTAPADNESSQIREASGWYDNVMSAKSASNSDDPQGSQLLDPLYAPQPNPARKQEGRKRFENHRAEKLLKVAASTDEATFPKPLEEFDVRSAIEPKLLGMKDTEEAREKQSAQLSSEEPIVKKGPKTQSLVEMTRELKKKVSIISCHGALYFFNGHHYEYLDPDRLLMLYREYVDYDLNHESSLYGHKDLYQCYATDPDIQRKEPKGEPIYAPLKNGIFVLAEKKLYPHSPDRLTFTYINAKYKPKAECPVFDSFLWQVTHGNPQLLERFWMAIGYLFIYPARGKFFILMGYARDSGKSVLGNFIQRLYPKESVSNLRLSEMKGTFALMPLLSSVINFELDMPNTKLNAEAISRLIIHKIVTDKQVLSDLIDKEELFWMRHIVPQIPPAPNGSDGDTQQINQLYEVDDRDKNADLTSLRGLLDKRQEISSQIEQLEQEKTAIEQQVKLEMQDAAYGTAPGYKVSWVSSESKRVDSQRLRKEQPDIFNQYSKNVSSRRFTIIHAA